MPALSKKNRRERRRFTAVIITYGKQGQGHHRGDEQETWRRRLLFTTARRNPFALTMATTMPHHGDKHAAPRRTSVAFSAGLIVSNTGGGETGEVETWDDFGYLSGNVGGVVANTPSGRSSSRHLARGLGAGRPTGGQQAAYERSTAHSDRIFTIHHTY